VSAWGQNNAGQTQVPPGLTNVISVAGGGLHSLALKSDGAVSGWGYDAFGQATVPPGLGTATAIAAGDSYSVAVISDGSVIAWGNLIPPPLDLTNVTLIAGGFDHALALRGDGTVVSWGSISDVPAIPGTVIALAAGKSNSLALLANGTVFAWGDNSFGKASVPASATNIVAIAAGLDHCLALRKDGIVIAWGGNYDNQASVPPGVTNVVAIAAGGVHSLAIKANGTLAAWGDNTFNQSSINSTNIGFFAIAGGGFHSLGVHNDGSPVILVQPSSQSVDIGKDTTFQVIAVGRQPLTYQWQLNGTNILNATNSVVPLKNIQLSDGGAYTVTVGNLINSTPSAAAVLTPLPTPPFVVFQPQPVTVICGEAASFQGTGDGARPLFYQWLFQGAPVSGATQTSLNIQNVTSNQVGLYSIVVTNAFGSVTSPPAQLSLVVQTPAITSSLNVPGKQGQPFTYMITALHTPLSFTAAHLPAGLSINTTNGIISGTPLGNGVFGPTIGAANACASDTETLLINLASSVPIITSSLVARGTEVYPFNYQIRASDNPTSFNAMGLPPGLTINVTNGVISGVLVYAGTFPIAISASNEFGVGSAELQLIVTNAPIFGLSMTNYISTYSTPYLLDFEFTIRNDNDPSVGGPLVVAPSLLSGISMEDGETNSPTETTVTIAKASAKLIKAFLVLDYTESIASLTNGDSNGDGISDAVDAMVAGARDFVDQMPLDAQLGVYEFHREDEDPQRVVNLTMNKTLLDNSIAGIWTNYVQWFPAGSRCWDALTAAINNLGPANPDEQHFIVFVSDGVDDSSTNTAASVITSASNNGIRLFCIGFGAELNPGTLQNIAQQTGGGYYDAAALGGITSSFDQIGKELNSRYLFRWPTLKRATNQFLPSWEVTYQSFQFGSFVSFTAISPAPIIITNPPPPGSTNPPTITTNYPIPFYYPGSNAGPVTVGSLRLVATAVENPQAVVLRAFYVPRYIRQINIHYRPNWPCTPTLLNNGPGEILNGWSLTETNDGAGGRWLRISSAFPQSLSNSVPFGSLGGLIHFALRDMTNAQTAFSSFVVDNTYYTNTGGQSFTLDNVTNFVTVYPALPHSTPIPWLIANGFTNNFTAGEVSDPDGDGVPTWMEYMANTDPHNPNSRFVIRRVVQQPDGRYQITFSTSSNRVYRLDYSTNLVNWLVLQDNIPGVGADVTITDPIYIQGSRSRYYRVLVR
jgi:alpha-tubulin suppressor-like RCC1 family protein